MPAILRDHADVLQPNAPAAGFDANFVLLNLHRVGSDHIGWHSDDETDLIQPSKILSLSLGAARDFQFRRRDGRASHVETVTLQLQAGSLLTLADPTNKVWQHQSPRRGGQYPEHVGRRLNLTWRQVWPSGEVAHSASTTPAGGPSRTVSC